MTKRKIYLLVAGVVLAVAVLFGILPKDQVSPVLEGLWEQISGEEDVPNSGS